MKTIFEFTLVIFSFTPLVMAQVGGLGRPGEVSQAKHVPFSREFLRQQLKDAVNGKINVAAKTDEEKALRELQELFSHRHNIQLACLLRESKLNIHKPQSFPSVRTGPSGREFWWADDGNYSGFYLKSPHIMALIVVHLKEPYKRETFSNRTEEIVDKIANGKFDQLDRWIVEEMYVFYDGESTSWTELKVEILDEMQKPTSKR